MRVLVVEDSEKLREAVKTALRRSGFSVDATGDGEEGLWLAENNPYDALILDIMLPGIDGLTILERLRQQDNPSPVLLLTAKDTIDDRVGGLNAGADDYVVKPFALKEHYREGQGALPSRVWSAHTVAPGRRSHVGCGFEACGKIWQRDHLNGSRIRNPRVSATQQGERRFSQRHRSPYI